MRHYSAAIELAPTNPVLYSNRAMDLISPSVIHSRIHPPIHTDSLAPWNTHTIFSLWPPACSSIQGNECFRKGDFAEAVRHYSAAIELAPTNPVLYSNRAMALLKLKKCVEGCCGDLSVN